MNCKSMMSKETVYPNYISFLVITFNVNFQPALAALGTIIQYLPRQAVNKVPVKFSHRSAS